jgi:putative photosynthetic complex assembly protein 2
MADYVLPALFALFLWWFATGAILFLDGLPQRTFKWSMLGATAVLAGAFYMLWGSVRDTTVGGAYAAFTSGVLIWGWHQISFYMGYVTGTRTARCPHGCAGWRHFRHALEASLYHELAILASLAAIVWLSWDAANQIGLWTFLLLWWMHESARLNVFLGVRNLNEDWLPDHMAFIKGYMTKKPMNLLFPFSVTISTLATMWTAQQALAAGTPFEAAAYSFLTALLALAVLEHWFLVLPLPADKLWSWGLASREPVLAKAAAAGPCTSSGKGCDTARL